MAYISQEYSDSLTKLQEMVETTVDLDALDNHEFIIKPEFDESLRIIRKRLDKLKYDMEVEHRKVGQDLSQDTDKKLFLENHKVHGWCFRLTRNVSTVPALHQEHNSPFVGSRLYTEQEAIPRMLNPEKRCLLYYDSVADLAQRV